MTDTQLSGTPRMHPVLLIAAIAVILTCMFAIGVMTGIVPSPMTKTTPPAEALSAVPQKAPAATGLTREDLRQNRDPASVASGLTREDLRENRSTPRASAPDARATSRTAERPPVGRTQGSAASSSVAGGSSAPAQVAAACTNCGSVSSVRAVTQQGEAGLIGPAAGTLLGGVAGSQIGSGSGKTIATVIGAGAGAAIGTEVERRSKSTTSYVVGVRMNDGTTRSFTYPNEPGVSVGDRVRLVDGRLLRD
jgi:outer membrane lipoprotein SlyB